MHQLKRSIVFCVPPTLQGQQAMLRMYPDEALNVALEQLHCLQVALAATEQELEQLTAQQQRKVAAAEQVQLAAHALQLVESRVASSAAHTAQQTADTLKRQAEEAKDEQQQAEEHKKALQATVKARCLRVQSVPCYKHDSHGGLTFDQARLGAQGAPEPV